MESVQLNRVVTKYLRLRFTDQIRQAIDAIPHRNMKETRGDDVYQANGDIFVKDQWYSANISISLVQDQFCLNLCFNGKTLNCSLDPQDVRDILLGEPQHIRH